MLNKKLLLILLTFSLIPFISGSCVDSDGGKNWDVKGITKATNVSYGNTYYEDRCMLKTEILPGSWKYNFPTSCFGINCFVLDGFCTDTGLIANGVYNCPNECSNGACVQDYITVSSCGILDKPNSIYTLNQSINSSRFLNCIIIQANNITLDLNGFNITGNGTYVIINNTNISRYSPYGIYSNYNLTTIKNGNIYKFYSGIYLNSSSNNIITNYTASNNYYGIYIINSNSNTLENIITNNNTLPGIQFAYSNNNTLTNITSNLNYDGIRFYSSNNSILTNIIANDNRADGIYIPLSSNNIFTNIITNNNNQRSYSSGIEVYLSSNNIFTNITSNSNKWGISINGPGGPGDDRGSNNVFTNITTNNNTVVGIGLYYKANNSTFTNVISNSNNLAVYLYWASNNTFKDSTFTTTNNTLIRLMQGPVNAIFLNSTYNSSKENITYGTLIRKWYLNTQVNYTHKGIAVFQANVTAWNSSNNIQFSTLTDGTGKIPQQQVIEYVNKYGTKNYFNPYTIEVSKEGYNSINQTLNISQNTLLQYNLKGKGV